ncbi:MAG TPA: aldo/keto reductase [Azospirillaceae bacterium]|nr:aldo/keto reductase [Azospirillaceae bacterium]
MHHVMLKGGGRMPALGLGTYRLTGAEGLRAIRTALEIGYRHLDTAAAYGNEAEVGRAVRESGIDRADLFVTTKVWMDRARAAEVRASADESLGRLGMDYVDLLLFHWPAGHVPLAETLGGLMAVKTAGKARAIGVSNFPVALMREAVECTGGDIACNQIEYHVGLRQTAVLDEARRHGIVVTAYSPLGKGDIIDDPVLARIGARHGKSAAQVALRWLVQQDGVAAIPRSRSEANLRANLDIFDFRLSPGEMAAVSGLGGTNRMVNPSWAPDWDPA